MLRQHSFKTKCTYLKGGPLIKIPLKVAQDIPYLIRAGGNNEISCLGSVEQLAPLTFRLDSLHLFKQKVNSTETVMDQENLGEFFHELITKFGPEAANKIRHWGHLHPFGSTSPSPQDNEQMKEFSTADWFIRSIFTTCGDIEFTLYYYALGLIFEDVPWELDVLEDADRAAEILAEAKEKVTVIPESTRVVGNRIIINPSLMDTIEELEVDEEGFPLDPSLLMYGGG